MPTDYLQTENGDLDLSTGDLRTGESTAQHQRDILLARKGDYRTTPAVGVGLEDYALDESRTDLARNVRTQFAKDGMNVKMISVTPAKIDVDASY